MEEKINLTTDKLGPKDFKNLEDYLLYLNNYKKLRKINNNIVSAKDHIKHNYPAKSQIEKKIWNMEIIKGHIIKKITNIITNEYEFIEN